MTTAVSLFWSIPTQSDGQDVGSGVFRDRDAREALAMELLPIWRRDH